MASEYNARGDLSQFLIFQEAGEDIAAPGNIAPAEVELTEGTRNLQAGRWMTERRSEL
jgi:hypothetical protein